VLSSASPTCGAGARECAARRLGALALAELPVLAEVEDQAIRRPDAAVQIIDELPPVGVQPHAPVAAVLRRSPSALSRS
jgi:hypothetical protein